MLVCVGLPAYDGKVCARTVDSLLAEQFLAERQGVHLLVKWEIGNGLIGIARSKLARAFLEVSEASCIVYVDTDISWAGGDLLKLALSPHDVIGATYRPKHEPEQYHIRGDLFEPLDGGLFKVGGLPGGFLKISRRAFETVKADAYTDDAGRDMHDWFPVGLHDGRMYGEDYGFCRLWRASGGDVILDPGIRLRHHDGNTVYAGDPAKWIAGLER